MNSTGQDGFQRDSSQSRRLNECRANQRDNRHIDAIIDCEMNVGVGGNQTMISEITWNKQCGTAGKLREESVSTLHEFEQQLTFLCRFARNWPARVASYYRGIWRDWTFSTNGSDQHSEKCFSLISTASYRNIVFKNGGKKLQPISVIWNISCSCRWRMVLDDIVISWAADKGITIRKFDSGAATRSCRPI